MSNRIFVPVHFMRKFAEQKLSSMTENILYDILDINILKRIKKVSQFWGLLFRFHFSQKCKKSSIISITDDLISEFAKQKIISMIGNILYDIIDVNILKTIFCHAPLSSPLILYLRYWGGVPKILVECNVLWDPENWCFIAF